ncbi:glutathione reductase, chloroplastic-like [Miscanthus floridulus]|uniref:glutathione reductase, chloroplastic-like n=1 Tax=Miscanthus floridulus TaxID=154761 RepID=UPI00345AB8D1
MAAATLPSASAKVAVRNIARAVSSSQPLLLLHASSRRGRGLHPLPLAASAASQGAHLRRALSVSASAAAGGNNGFAPRAAEREYDYDLFTIGAGSGGMRASRVASALYGARAAVCEMPFATVASDALGGVGGTCVLRGCVPKKLLVYASKYSHEFEESHGFGWVYETDPKHDWRTLITNKNLELQRLVGIQTNTLKNSGVTVIEGRGKIVDPHTVSVDGKLYTAKNILVAVGGRPSKPNIPGIEHVIDSDAALDLPSRPEKIAIVGGGYIALEFAGVFNGLKSDVHVFIRQKKVLRGFDEEVRDFVAEQMSLRGVKFHIEQSPEAVTKSDDGLLSLKTNKETVSGFSHVMFATGRKPNTKNLGLEDVGVKMDEHGAIVVDEYSRTSVDSIWAVGDVTNRLNLTPVALMEAGAIARTIFGNEPTRADYSAVPSAVFSQPPIGHVGLTEDEATETYGDIDIYISNFKPLRVTLSGLPDRVFMKVIVCAKTNKVLGVHMCGEDAPEIIQGIAIAVKAGLTKQNFDSTIGVHPTTAEEFVTMRNPTRKVRRDTTAEAKTKDEAASQK